MTRTKNLIKPDFSPDYAQHWDDTDLTGEQAAALALGLSPGALERFSMLYERGRFQERGVPNPAIPQEHHMTEEEATFWNAFIKFCYNDWWPPGRDGGEYPSSRAAISGAIATAIQLTTLWNEKFVKGDKKEFVLCLYAHGTPATTGREIPSDPHPGFVAFLKERGEWPDCWDHYKNPDQYFLNRETFDFDREIKTPEETAIALYGLVPEHELRHRALQKPGHEFSLEEYFFYRSRRDSLEAGNSPCEDGGLGTLLKIMENDRLSPAESRRLPVWTESFSTYLQALYDAGVIFAEHMKDIIRRYYRDGMEYSAEEKPVAMYRKWNANSAWTFEQACLLYAGTEPATRGFNLINLRGDRHLFMLRDVVRNSGDKKTDEHACTPESPDKMENLRNRAICHVTARTLIPLNSDERDHEKWMFDPQRITQWLIGNTTTAPLPPLVEVLGLDKSSQKKAQPISEAALEREYKKYINDCISKNVIPSWEDDWSAMESALGKRPTKKQIKAVRAKLAPDSWKQQGRRRAA